MRPTPDTLKLPAQLVHELGGHDILSRGRKGRGNLITRKEKRRTERAQKKARRDGVPPSKRPKLWNAVNRHRDNGGPKIGIDFPNQPLEDSIKGENPSPKSILKAPKQPENRCKSGNSFHSPSLIAKRLSRGVEAKLAEDDEEIAALEKKLGMKGWKGLPKAFKDDGLDELLDGLDGDSDGSIQGSRRKEAVGEEWLAQKRKKAELSDDDDEEEKEGEEEEEYDGPSIEDKSVAFGMSFDGSTSDGVEGDLDDSGEDNAILDSRDDFECLDSESDAASSPQPHKHMRENPYVAPTSQSDLAHAKYIPPSLRKPSSSDTEALVRLRRQVQGLVNRLTEANFISVLGDIEKIYRENARQHVTSTLVDLLLISVCEPTSLADTLIILSAGFIAAIYKIIGTDFGAQVIQRIVDLFDEHYVHGTKVSNSGPAAATAGSSKETSNLATLLANLYNFQVVGSTLIFDYIRMFLNALSEVNAELLLKVIRTSGPQLRQDDPSSLKDIVNMLRPAVNNMGEENISVRTKFMIETINDLKNNRMKTGAIAFTVTSEHTIRMRKTLGTLNGRNVKASEPLRIGLKDIQELDKKGKWWLVGASWVGHRTQGNADLDSDVATPKHTDGRAITNINVGESDLVQLAREQGMNTDIRRAIFITIMSASDYQDAYLRLVKLKLKKIQELEIPKVLLHCSSAEKQYNPYYTLIAKKLCRDRKLKMAFQFNLWGLFKRLGEGNDDEDVTEQKNDDDSLDTRQLVNLAKMFGALIVEGGLSLSILKNLNLGYLQSKTKMFVEILFITIFLQIQRQQQDKRDEQAVRNIVSKVTDTPEMIRGLQYFLKKVVSKTDIAGGKAEMTTVKWSCKIAGGILMESIIAADASQV